MRWGCCLILKPNSIFEVDQIIPHNWKLWYNKYLRELGLKIL